MDQTNYPWNYPGDTPLYIDRYVRSIQCFCPSLLPLPSTIAHAHARAHTSKRAGPCTYLLSSTCPFPLNRHTDPDDLEHIHNISLFERGCRPPRKWDDDGFARRWTRDNSTDYPYEVVNHPYNFDDLGTCNHNGHTSHMVTRANGQLTTPTTFPRQRHFFANHMPSTLL